MAAPHLTKFEALVVDPDQGNRMRLKQACGAVVNFGKVNQFASPMEALKFFGLGSRIDVVFFSKTFGQDAMTAFVRDAKTTTAGQDAAYILVLSEDGASATVAQSVLGGSDGFLFAPYSVDRLVEITLLAAKVGKERSATREAAAIKFLLADIMKQIDLLAYSKSCGYDSGSAIRAFKQACSVLGSLSPESREIYYQLAVEIFEAAPLPAGLEQRKKYAGASSRLKKKMGEKLAAEMGNSNSGDPSA